MRPPPFFPVLAAAALVAAGTFAPGDETETSTAPLVEPAAPIQLFNGKDLSSFDTWLEGHGRADPDRVFSVVDQVDGAPAIRVSGKTYGGLITRERYANYRLIVEYRWGLATWGGRRDAARDNGILLHSTGEEGNTKKDFSSPWMRSIEFQIIEGGVGDMLLLAGYDRNGSLHKTKVKAPTRKDRDGELVFDPGAEPVEHEGVRINWTGRDVDWTDKLGMRGKDELESPPGAWTRLEAVCQGASLRFFVNGKLANAGTDANLSSGRILLQSEGAEIYFRRVELRPLGEDPARPSEGAPER